ncbi:MAG: hypothetical protein RL568_1091, partial [Actinomycetota bacterium]
WMRGFARGYHHERVVGGGVAIDGDAIERRVGQIGGQGRQQTGVDVGIGGQETQHGGHVGANHARAFADASDGDGLARQHHLRTVGLGHRVGGHDAFCGFGPVCRLRIGNGGRHAGHNAIDRQVLHDDASGERQNLLRLHFEQGSHGIRSSARIGQAFGTSACIGIARVNHQGPNLGVGLRSLDV